MKTIYKSLKVIDPQSPFHNQVVDIAIENARVIDIASHLEGEGLVFPKGTFIAPGFFDLHAHFGEPGFETNETLESGTRAALKGGFTGVCLMPDTNPAIDSRQGVEFINARNRNSELAIYPAGTLTLGREGKEMAELYDMQQGGAIAFTDHKRSISDAGLMQRILLYAKGIKARVMTFADTREISHSGLMNEGEMSTLLGIKGVPNLAEYLAIGRDIALCEYLETNLHFSCISTAEGVELIRQAKAKGVSITCDVAAHNLFFTDQDLFDFNTNLKLNPPVRTESDRQALIQGLIDGTIDAICSDHRPESVEAKEVEFDYASKGAIGLESFWGQVYSSLNQYMSLTEMLDRVSIRPRKILGLPIPSIQKGANVSFVIFETESTYEFTKSEIVSKSKNSPVIGRNLQGKVLASLS